MNPERTLDVLLGIILVMSLGKLLCAWIGLEEGDAFGIDILGDAVGIKAGDAVRIKVGDIMGFTLGVAAD